MTAVTTLAELQRNQLAALLVETSDQLDRSRATAAELLDALFQTTGALQIAIQNLNAGVSSETVGTLTQLRLDAEAIIAKATAPTT